MNTGFNRQGRSVSHSMRLRAFVEWSATQPKKPTSTTTEHRGFQVYGRASKWTISGGDPRVFTSKASALAAIDACLALRAEMAADR